jgi:hypothetical protein
MATGVKVWIQPELLGSDNITVLTDNALCLGSLARSDLAAAKQRIEGGAPPEQVLGGAGRSIPLASLRAVQLSNREATLSLGFLDGQRRAEHTTQYCTPRQQKVFAALREKLGPGWQEEAVAQTAWSALSLPLLVTGFLAFFAFIGFMAARQEESGFVHETGKGEMGGALAGAVGTVGFLVIGGIVVVGGLVWMLYAIRNRAPAVVTLKRAGADGGGSS